MRKSLDIFVAKHVPGVDNSAADMLSRIQSSRLVFPTWNTNPLKFRCSWCDFEGCLRLSNSQLPFSVYLLSLQVGFYPLRKPLLLPLLGYVPILYLRLSSIWQLLSPVASLNSWQLLQLVQSDHPLVSHFNLGVTKILLNILLLSKCYLVSKKVILLQMQDFLLHQLIILFQLVIGLHHTTSPNFYEFCLRQYSF